MPAKDSVWGYDTGDLEENFAAYGLAKFGQSTTLVIVERGTLSLQLILKDTVLFY